MGTKLTSTNLPAQITSFVGRRLEVAQVKQALRAHRLVTIVGPGGAGKTRLALEAAQQLVRAYGNACFFIDLGKLPAGVPITDDVATQLRLTREAGQWTSSDLAERLSSRRLLLILDNCEHVLESAAEVAGTVLRHAGGVDVLATSRQALGLTGEQLWQLDGLSYPVDDHSDSPGELAAVESVQLFLERGRSTVPDFALTEDNAASVAHITRRLEGSPLAIELAAARLRVLAPHQIATRLDNQFRLLGSSRSPDERHQTLRAAIGWSYDLCTPVEQLCWARLSVFPADFDIEAAEAVAGWGALDRDVVLDTVSALIDKSILRTSPSTALGTRYRFTESVRDFGRQKLDDHESVGPLLSRHLEHFSEMSAAVPGMLFGPAQAELTDSMRAEQANLQLALTQAMDADEMDTADSLACIIALTSFASGSLNESSRALHAVTSRRGDKGAARVLVLWLSAWLAINQGDIELAETRATECRTLAQLIDDRHGLVQAHQYLGEVQLMKGDVHAAETYCRRAVSAARQLDNDHPLATSLVRLAQVLDTRGRTDEAQAALVESISISDQAGENWCRGFAVWSLALLMQATGRPAEGESNARAALDAKELFQDVVGVGQALEVLAWCLGDLGEHDRAAVLLGAADAVWTLTGAVLPQRLVPRRSACEQRLQAALGVDAYRELRQEGNALTPAAAMRWLDGVDGGPADARPETDGLRAEPESRPTDVLTPRELEVAHLVAEGLKNREIAQLLLISPRTAEAHVEHILTKLGFTSRSQISSWSSYQPER